MANTNWNPSDKTASITLTGSNLIATVSALGIQGVRSVYGTSSGKYYWEWTYGINVSVACGIATLALPLTTNAANGVAGAATANIAGSTFINSTTNSASLGTLVSSLVCIALDLDAQRIWFRKGAAGNWNNSGTANPAAGTGGFALTFVGAGGTAAYAYFTGTSATNGSSTANFGDTAFTGTPPAGFFLGFPGAAPVVPPTQSVRVMVMA